MAYPGKPTGHQHLVLLVQPVGDLPPRSERVHQIGPAHQLWRQLERTDETVPKAATAAVEQPGKIGCRITDCGVAPVEDAGKALMVAQHMSRTDVGVQQDPWRPTCLRGLQRRRLVQQAQRPTVVDQRNYAVSEVRKNWTQIPSLDANSHCLRNGNDGQCSKNCGDLFHDPRDTDPTQDPIVEWTSLDPGDDHAPMRRTDSL